MSHSPHVHVARRKEEQHGRGYLTGVSIDNSGRSLGGYELAPRELLRSRGVYAPEDYQNCDDTANEVLITAGGIPTALDGLLADSSTKANATGS